MTRPAPRRVMRVVLAASLGVLAAVLVSCGSSGKGLIPAANAGPLQADFEAVEQAASNGNGNCTETESAIAKTEQDFNALPVTINAGLRTTLREGIANLAKQARALCAQPIGGTTTGTTAAKTTTETTPTATTPTVTQPTTTTPPPTTSTPPPTPGTGGGTPAPEGAEESGGAGPSASGGAEGGK